MEDIVMGLRVVKKNDEAIESVKKRIAKVIEKAEEVDDILDSEFVAYFRKERFAMIVTDYYSAREVLNNALRISDVAMLKLENNMKDANDETISKKIYALSSLNQSIVDLSKSIAELHDDYDKVIRNVMDVEEDEDEDDEEDDPSALYKKPKK